MTPIPILSADTVTDTEFWSHTIGQSLGTFFWEIGAKVKKLLTLSNLYDSHIEKTVLRTHNFNNLDY